jgi:hypothetical protein
MRLSRALFAAVCAVTLAAAPALADEPISFTGPIVLDTGATKQGKQIVDAAHPLPVTSGLSPWLPDDGSLLTLAPTGTSAASSAFAGSGTTVYVKNTGSQAFHVRVGSVGVTATTSDERLQPGMCGPFSRNSGDRVALITDTGTGAAEITTGTGNPGFGICVDLSAASAVYNLPTSPVSGLTAAMTGTTSTAVTGMGAPGSGLRNYITTAACGNSHATVGTFVEFQDGSGGTTFFTVPAAAVYGGSITPFPAPLKQPTANTALYVKDTTTGANVVCSFAGFKAP